MDRVLLSVSVSRLQCPSTAHLNSFCRRSAEATSLLQVLVRSPIHPVRGQEVTAETFLLLCDRSQGCRPRRSTRDFDPVFWTRTYNNT